MKTIKATEYTFGPNFSLVPLETKTHEFDDNATDEELFKKIFLSSEPVILDDIKKLIDEHNKKLEAQETEGQDTDTDQNEEAKDDNIEELIASVSDTDTSEEEETSDDDLAPLFDVDAEDDEAEETDETEAETEADEEVAEVEDEVQEAFSTPYTFVRLSDDKGRSLLRNNDHLTLMNSIISKPSLSLVYRGYHSEVGKKLRDILEMSSSLAAKNIEPSTVRVKFDYPNWAIDYLGIKEDVIKDNRILEFRDTTSTFETIAAKQTNKPEYAIENVSGYYWNLTGGASLVFICFETTSAGTVILPAIVPKRSSEKLFKLLTTLKLKGRTVHRIHESLKSQRMFHTTSHVVKTPLTPNDLDGEGGLFETVEEFADELVKYNKTIQLIGLPTRYRPDGSVLEKAFFEPIRTMDFLKKFDLFLNYIQNKVKDNYIAPKTVEVVGQLKPRASAKSAQSNKVIKLAETPKATRPYEDIKKDVLVAYANNTGQGIVNVATINIDAEMMKDPNIKSLANKVKPMFDKFDELTGAMFMRVDGLLDAVSWQVVANDKEKVTGVSAKIDDNLKPEFDALIEKLGGSDKQKLYFLVNRTDDNGTLFVNRKPE